MDYSAQGRLQDRKPVAVIDIGSNSIRLVVYEGLSRSPTPLFQEKAMCGLGRFLNSTRRLNEETIPFALASLCPLREARIDMRRKGARFAPVRDGGGPLGGGWGGIY